MKPFHTRGAVVVALALTAIAAVAMLRPVRADESKRRALIDEINRLLSDIAGELGDVPGDSSTSDLERTVGYASTVHDKARELRDHVDGDSDARRISEYYPDYAKRYQDAARYLKELKLDHRRLDELPRKCEDSAKELATRLRGFTDTHDPRGTEEIPKLAREFGRIGKEAVDQAEGTRRMIQERYERVINFSDRDGKWSDVHSKLHGAAAAMNKHTTQMNEQLKRDEVCGNLSKAERNPLVEEAMKKLFEGKRGIELLYESMDRQLAETASALDGLVGDSNASDIQTAESKLGEVERMLEQLDRIKGNDSEAKRRVEAWRNNARSGRDGLKHLRVLKEAQFLADKAPDKCRDTSSHLRDLIRGFVDKRDSKGVTQIPLRARGFAEPVKAGLAKTDEQHPVMERALSDAQRFDPSEGRWRDVTDKHRGSATAIFEYWKKAREAAHAACDELAKGDQAREVAEAVEKLKGGATSEIEQYKKDVDAFIQDARALFLLDCTELENLWLALCGADEEPNESPDRDAARAEARAIGAQMRTRIDPILQRHDALKKRGEALVQEDETKARATTILASMDEILAKLRRIENGGALKGNDHPMSQYAAEYGKQMHDNYAGKYKCDVYDQPYEGAGGRPDCVVANNGCWVYEFKPDTKKAKEIGEGQLDRYVPAVTKYYQERISRNAGSDSTKQGQITDDVKGKCMASDKVFFKREVVTYPLCEKRFECVR